jgi:hypothetical protein
MWNWRNRGFPQLGGGGRPAWPAASAPPAPTRDSSCTPTSNGPGYCDPPPPPPKWPPPPCPPKPCTPKAPTPTPTPPGPHAPASSSPLPQAPALTRARLVDLFFSEIPTSDVSYFFREGRVAYTPGASATDGSGNILSYRVPDAQTLLISDVEFYAQAPNPAVVGDQITLDPRRLTGFVGVHILVDDRSPLDLYSLIQMPQAEFSGTQDFMGSAFSYLGHVLGGAERQPHVFLRAREGQTVRLAYTVANAPTAPVTNIGAVVRGYVIPSTILAAKTASG